MRKISIVVPVWNEENNVTELTKRIHAVLSKAKIGYEIIFVDDKSTDNTLKILKKLCKKYPISFYTKQGKQGKAFSLIEGFEKATHDIIVMIDADLQYSPEAIAAMVEKIQNGADIVVANRVTAKSSPVRKFISKAFKYLFAEVLFGLKHDVQAGLKVFRKDILSEVSIHPRSGWAFDLELLHKAKKLGYKIENYDISFEKRQNGNSKVSLIKASWEIGSNAIAVKLFPMGPVHVHPNSKNSMQGAGIKHKGIKYITHTTLHHTQSAIQTFTLLQKIFFLSLCIAIIAGLLVKTILTLQILVGSLSFVYFIDVCFNLFLILKSLHVPQEISVSESELQGIDESLLPVYSILCPLYKEAHIIPQFLEAINKLDYPKEKLDVMLLLEEDDKHSISEVEKMVLPSYVRTIVVPHSLPKTKPKACNYGLAFAKGEYLVIYDAEDSPESLQLKKAYLGFQKVDKTVFCLQAKLNYYNPDQNLLTRFFTAEYSLWFDITLTGLQSINTSIPLGGTSNHFKTANLKKLEGWDPFNVTEDADLGIRLFKKGYKTAIIDSLTLEEANSKWGNWLRQRSRWIKGYMQTYLVHTRKQVDLFKKIGYHGIVFHLVIGGKIAFILINPLLWIATISYFVAYKFVGPTIESLYPPFVFYMAGFSLVFGNFLFLYYYMIGCAKREQWSLIKYVFLVPFYWLMISIAGGIALYQLILKPHYWEKTVHGLHLKKAEQKFVFFEFSKIAYFPLSLPRQSILKLQAILKQEKLTAGSIFIVANAIASIFTLLFSIYLGRKISFEDFALVSLINGLLAIVALMYGALGTTMSYKTSFLAGKEGDAAAVLFWATTRKKALYISYAITGIWIVCTPLLIHYFRLPSIFPIILFSPILLFDLAASADKGILFSKLNFKVLSLLTILEPFLRFALAVILVSTHADGWTYIVIPIAAVFTFFIGWLFVRKYKKVLREETKVYTFPFKFFFMSLLSGISVIIFLNLDILLAKHYLPASQAGLYALTATIAKMFYFLSSLAAPFTVPFVSRNEGANVDSARFLKITMAAVLLITVPPFILFALLGNIFVPLLFGHRAVAVLPYVSIFIFSQICFSVARVYADYYLAKRYYSFTVISFVLGGVNLILLHFFHTSVWSFVLVMSGIWIANLITTYVLHMYSEPVRIFERNVTDFFELFTKTKKHENKKSQALRILIFNWRDTKHKWAGGAEKYIHELAKRWAKDGNQVTIFCGNDSLHSRTEVVDGITIIRRGGFYTVYLWAFLYYVLRFRNNFDVIIDSENGIPFFTPLYSRIPVYLLIHHVHQEIHRKQLRFPLSQIALFLEGKLMPFVYKHTTVLTVSESSKDATLELGFTEKNKVLIIHPGVNEELYTQREKTSYPSLLYLGRLKPYKNIEIAIRAFAKITKKIPDAIFTIAGEGESRDKLIKLANDLRISEKVVLTGTVTEEKKQELYATSWLCVQPSIIEGWGITVIEANAAGTPVVASKVNGLKDSVIHGKTGYLVNPKSADEFAQAFEKVLTNSTLRKTMGKRAIEWSKKFSWEASATVFYQELITSVERDEYAFKLGFSIKKAYEKA